MSITRDIFVNVPCENNIDYSTSFEIYKLKLESVLFVFSQFDIILGNDKNISDNTLQFFDVAFDLYRDLVECADKFMPFFVDFYRKNNS